MNRIAQASKLCEIVAQEAGITSATVRVTAWMLGVSSLTGERTLELSYRQVRDGFLHKGKAIAGTGSRIETIKAAFDWLETRGYLTIKAGTNKSFGHTSHIYELDLSCQNTHEDQAPP